MFNIVLFCPEIPQNTGNIGRLAVSNDCTLHLIKPLGYTITDTALKRAGLDYWEHLSLVIHESWEEFVIQEDIIHKNILFLSTRGEKSIYEYHYVHNDYLIFGNESSGLSTKIYDTYEESLYYIPMLGKNSRSLNLANSVAITLYEGLRQVCI